MVFAACLVALLLAAAPALALPEVRSACPQARVVILGLDCSTRSRQGRRAAGRQHCARVSRERERESVHRKEGESPWGLNKGSHPPRGSDQSRAPKHDASGPSEAFGWAGSQAWRANCERWPE